MKTETEIRICSECDSDQVSEKSIGDEGFTVCDDCQTIEGNTYYITLEEYEKRFS